jgi:hypothetical protein
MDSPIGQGLGLSWSLPTSPSCRSRDPGSRGGWGSGWGGSPAPVFRRAVPLEDASWSLELLFGHCGRSWWLFDIIARFEARVCGHVVAFVVLTLTPLLEHGLELLVHHLRQVTLQSVEFLLF